MTNTITIEFSAEDRARLDRIAAALEGAKPKCDSCVSTALDAMKAAQSAPMEFTKEEPQPEPTKPTAAQEPPQTATEDKPTVSVADIQRKVVALSNAGKKAEVREIVKAYADKVSGIPEDKLGEVWAQLTALEG